MCASPSLHVHANSHSQHCMHGCCYYWWPVRLTHCPAWSTRTRQRCRHMALHWHAEQLPSSYPPVSSLRAGPLAAPMSISGCHHHMLHRSISRLHLHRTSLNQSVPQPGRHQAHLCSSRRCTLISCTFGRVRRLRWCTMLILQLHGSMTLAFLLSRRMHASPIPRRRYCI